MKWNEEGKFCSSGQRGPGDEVEVGPSETLKTLQFLEGHFDFFETKQHYTYVYSSGALTVLVEHTL